MDSTAETTDASATDNPSHLSSFAIREVECTPVKVDGKDSLQWTVVGDGNGDVAVIEDSKTNLGIMFTKVSNENAFWSQATSQAYFKVVHDPSRPEADRRDASQMLNYLFFGFCRDNMTDINEEVQRAGNGRFRNSYKFEDMKSSTALDSNADTDTVGREGQEQLQP